MQPDYDLDDLMGEARLAFMKCVNSYPDVYDEKHFAALFRTTFTRQLDTIASKRRFRSGIAFTDLGGEIIENWFQQNLEDKTPGPEEEAEVRLMKLEAPPHIRRLLRSLVDGPAETNLTPRKIYRMVSYLRRQETDNEFLSRLAKVNPRRHDMAQEILNWVRGEQSPLTGNAGAV